MARDPARHRSGRLTQRLRGRAGQRQRQRRLRRTNGLCELCLADGRTTEATIVDHIVPLAHGGSDEDDNTRNVCAEHSRKVTAEQFGHQTWSGERGVNASGRPTGADHAWSQAGSPGAPPGGRKCPTPLAGHRAHPPYAAGGFSE
ncbi:HNH endonuclease [Sphingomonas endophytica]|uniref:HNH endonuclease n=1 Tax=Sphingomonas endophytica TaxID=869719 RepID=UPI001FE25245|nr:HNH endonuclease signature motif containing protein [Sphingomonas endophytica]